MSFLYCHYSQILFLIRVLKETYLIQRYWVTFCKVDMRFFINTTLIFHWKYTVYCQRMAPVLISDYHILEFSIQNRRYILEAESWPAHTISTRELYFKTGSIYLTDNYEELSTEVLLTVIVGVLKYWRCVQKLHFYFKFALWITEESQKIVRPKMVLIFVELDDQ